MPSNKVEPPARTIFEKKSLLTLDSLWLLVIDSKAFLCTPVESFFNTSVWKRASAH